MSNMSIEERIVLTNILTATSPVEMVPVSVFERHYPSKQKAQEAIDGVPKDVQSILHARREYFGLYASCWRVVVH